MKLEYVLTACNLDNVYFDCIPYFIKAWNKLYPKVKVRIVLLASVVPESILEYSENIILFNEFTGVNFDDIKDVNILNLSAFVSQYIRMLYPCIMDCENGIMISDVDMIPLNKTYFTDVISPIKDNQFVNFGTDPPSKNQFAMCYNVANSKVWREIFKAESKMEIVDILKYAYSLSGYRRNGRWDGWFTDQNAMYNKITDWNKTSKRFICSKKIPHNRLCRGTYFKLTPAIEENIKSGFYAEYHIYRPYTKYKKINDEIFEILNTLG